MAAEKIRVAGKINASELKLLTAADEPEEVVEIIRNAQPGWKVPARLGPCGGSGADCVVGYVA
jgi:hypothetical protein